ncbi:hypothetical protein GCM10022406_16320 [Hymenobacter algoricola]|uniref:Transcriptional regulator n=1 Tax=Hymenobacter algoricola TaxID=486267 RepID=A0ABP7N0Q1_9BACT
MQGKDSQRGIKPMPCQLMDYFQIGSCRTRYKILRFAGVEIPEKATT